MLITRKYKLLESVCNDGESCMDNSSDEIDEYWKLVREGYLKNFVSFKCDWIFRITAIGIAFVEEINKLIKEAK